MVTELTLNYTTGRHKDKKLCEAVMPGTHDAAMNTGGPKYKTQSLDIYNQAVMGVRIFDLRIREHNVGSWRKPVKELAGFHGGKAGREYGMTLEKILDDSLRYVKDYSEFVILKFDHCEGWDLIAEAIKDKIPTKYRLRNFVNLNLIQLRQLNSKIIPVFSSKGYPLAQKVGDPPLASEGIYPIKNLYPDKKYSDTYQGMQYFGKGLSWGLKSKKSVTWAVADQRKKIKVMTAREDQDLSDTLGMIYWTTIGATGSIETRTRLKWQKHENTFKNLWKDWLDQSVDQRVSVLTKLEQIRSQDTLDDEIPPPPPYTADMRLRTFMPNFVMIDFADEEKCDVIYDLNDIAASTLREKLLELQK